MVSRIESERRYKNIREQMEKVEIDGLIICGNEYTGFEGAVRYTSDFEIVHRYAYVVLPLAGDPTLLFPQEARWIGDKKKTWVQEHVWAEIPGQWIREHAQKKKWQRVGVYGMEFVMAVRDYCELANGDFSLVNFDREFDEARAIKSEEELEGVRDSMEIIVDGFWELVKAYQPGKTEAQIMAPAVELFFARGAGPQMMNIILSGAKGEAEAHFKVPGHRVVEPDDLLLYSLEIAGADGYWVEFSRPLIQGKVSDRTAAMKELYPGALEEAQKYMKDGERASSVHEVVADIMEKHGFPLGHLTGHSIGSTMLERPAIGATVDTELKENMVVSFHPQVIAGDGEVCLYTQDTYRIGKDGGERLADVPWRFFDGTETRDQF